MEVLFKSDNINFTYDAEYQLFMLKYTGVVPTEEFKHVVLTGAKILAENNGLSHVILDRRDLESYTAESRVWLKQDFMKNEGKALVKKVHKLAAVKPTTTMATIITSVFSGVFQIANPELEYRVFDEPEEALAWVKDRSKTQKRFFARLINMFKAEPVEQG